MFVRCCTGERASLHDGIYVEIHKRLQGCTTLCTHNAVYHHCWYANATSTSKLQCARDRHAHALATRSYTVKKGGQKRGSIEMDEIHQSSCEPPAPFTRSYTSPLDKKQCFFFCQENNSEQLYQVRTGNAGESLKEAVEQSDNDMLKTILSICIAPGNAHAIDVRYHKTCWTKYVLLGQREASTSDKKQSAKNHCCSVQVWSRSKQKIKHTCQWKTMKQPISIC